MGTEEASTHISDHVFAELVECLPEPEPSLCPQPAPAEASPTAQGATATIEQTGAEPPPRVSRG